MEIFEKEENIKSFLLEIDWTRQKRNSHPPISVLRDANTVQILGGWKSASVNRQLTHRIHVETHLGIYSINQKPSCIHQ